ncbi:hypothetical protein F5B17DRAFT_380169 [Nemania serpens]|nr:hypothetical protein F5B17DRAFT_380169 [Nemania serpens]
MSSSASQVNVAPLTNEDLPICFQLLSRSFGHDAPFVDIYFPHHDTPAGLIQGSKRLTAWKNGSPNSMFLKAVTCDNNDSPATEKVIGFAIWTLMSDVPPATIEEVEDVEEVWPDKQDREFMSRVWREYVGPRTQAVKESAGRGVYVLELLAVHPDFQGRGAGTKLVTWGIQEANKSGIKAIVEGTPAGRGVYEKCGFGPEIEEMRFEVGNEFADRVKPKLMFMTKEPTTQ